jgi:hypothetical protein
MHLSPNKIIFSVNYYHPRAIRLDRFEILKKIMFLWLNIDINQCKTWLSNLKRYYEYS